MIILDDYSSSEKMYHDLVNKVLFENGYTSFEKELDSYTCFLRKTTKIEKRINILNLNVETDGQDFIKISSSDQKKITQKTKDEITTSVLDFYKICNNDNHYHYGNMLYDAIRISSLLNFNSSSYELIIEEIPENFCYLKNATGIAMFWSIGRMKQTLIENVKNHMFNQGKISFVNFNIFNVGGR